MRLRQIEIFYQVYRTGSISGAARELNVSQPSVSKVLRHAEDQLGFDLFHRRKGRLVPTPQADEMFCEAEDIYRRLNSFNRSLVNIASRKGGHLRLGALPSLSLSVGPGLISSMREAAPLMSFELTTLHTEELATTLLEKRIDLAVGFSKIGDQRIESREVGTGRLVLVSGNSINAADSPVTARNVDGEDYIGTGDSGPIGELISGLFDKLSIAPHEVATAHTYHVALSLVRKQVGLAITDQFTAYSHLGAGLHRYMLHDLPEFPIYASALVEAADPRIVETTIATLTSVVANLDAGIAKLQPVAP